MACLDVLSDVDSEHEVDIEDSLSCDESDPESKEVWYSYSEISASQSDSEEQQDFDCGEILWKDEYVRSQKPKLSEEHQCAILSKRNQNRKGMNVKQTHPWNHLSCFSITPW